MLIKSEMYSLCLLLVYLCMEILKWQMSGNCGGWAYVVFIDQF
jgi:hypothetical protein